MLRLLVRRYSMYRYYYVVLFHALFFQKLKSSQMAILDFFSMIISELWDDLIHSSVSDALGSIRRCCFNWQIFTSSQAPNQVGLAATIISLLGCAAYSIWIWILSCLTTAGFN